MSEGIKFVKNGNIKLHLLKDEIDRRFALILEKILQNSPKPQIKPRPQTKDTGIQAKPDNEINDLNSLQANSNNSNRKQKIELSQIRCFQNLSSISEDIMNQFSFSLHLNEKQKHSSKNTARSNLLKNQNLLEKYKVRSTSRRTPLSNRINYSRSKSGMKKFSLDKPAVEIRQTITEQIIEQLKSSIQEQLNKSRRQLSEDNVRTNLLKRIQAMSRPKTLENQLI